ncbi:MAG TPA: hypothetical protein VG796_11960 [Verrucomicrobiales bacterium]|nr:hypothetical protein [Verrucomicrobiales bacterium]
MRALRFLRRYGLWLLVLAWLGSYSFLSFTGGYDRYELPAYRTWSIQPPCDAVWTPALLKVSEFQDWVDAPSFENLRHIPFRSLVYTPLIWIDWTFIHPRRAWPV